MIAQELALANPSASARSRSVAPTAAAPAASAPATRSGIASSPRSARATAILVLRTAWEINVSPTFAADEQQWALFVERAMRRSVALAVIAEQARAIAGHDTSARLGEIELPTLVIHGTLDQMLPVDNGRMIAELIPGARLEIFDGVGHLFFLERPSAPPSCWRAHAAVHA